jgi:outer membrane protein
VKTAILPALVLAAGVVAWAQGQPPSPAPPPPPGHPLSLDECVRIAVEHNPSAAVLLHAGRAAMARVGASKSAYWPAASLTGTLQRSYSEPEGGAQRFSSGSATNTSTNASLSAQYTLFDSGARKAAVASSQASYEASDAAFQATVQDLALSVQTAFFALEGAQWNLQVAKETQKQTGFHLEMAKAQHDVGLVPLSDVLQAETQDANAKLTVIQAQSDVKAGRAALAVLMGMPADSPLEIQAAERGEALPSLPDWQSGRDRALTVLPEIRQAFQNSEALRFSLKETRSSYLPSVTAGATAGLFDAGTWPNRQEWSAGLTLRVPVFTGFERKFQILQAKEAWEGSKMTLESVKLAAEKGAYDARTQLETALQAVDAARALVKSAQENSDVAEGQYQNGLGSMTNVVDATLALSSAKYRLVSAHLGALTALAQWKRATGEDLLEGASLPSTAVATDDSRGGAAAPSASDPMGETKP